MSFCKNCGTEHTPEMVAAKICFECGTEFVPAEDSHIHVMPVVISDDEVTFVEYEDLSIFTNQIQDVRKKLIHYMNEEVHTAEDYLDMINSMVRKGYLATIRSDINLINKVYEQINQYDLLEVGERLLLFVSQGKIENILSRGYLVTNKQIIFWDEESFSILELWQVDALGVNCEKGIWYLNELKDCQLSSPWCKDSEHAIIFALVFTLISKPQEKVERINHPAGQIKERVDQVEQMQKVDEVKKGDTMNVSNQTPSSLTEKLRELKELYEEGLITETDYEETKKRMLEKI